MTMGYGPLRKSQHGIWWEGQEKAVCHWCQFSHETGKGPMQCVIMQQRMAMNGAWSEIKVAAHKSLLGRCILLDHLPRNSLDVLRGVSRDCYAGGGGLTVKDIRDFTVEALEAVLADIKNGRAFDIRCETEGSIDRRSIRVTYSAPVTIGNG